MNQKLIQKDASSSTTKKQFRAALVQMRSGRCIKNNIDQAETLIREAAAAGAQYVQTPEATTLMEIDPKRLLEKTRIEEEDTGLQLFCKLAEKLKIWLHVGSIPIKTNFEKISNRSYLLSPEGNIVARYDKIHLFDVDLEKGESYRESQNYIPGQLAVCADLPWAKIGLSICYDLRFSNLYRSLAKNGATLLSVPSAFTKLTGEAHWHILLRARAIECQSYVLAAAQGGLHEHGRETYGHSLIISPWGNILAEGRTDPCVVLGDLDMNDVENVRLNIPSIKHDREFRF
ncbi:MAG: carbon-nitrogen hydrolase family protein [Hyphomicrobium sp.]